MVQGTSRVVLLAGVAFMALGLPARAEEKAHRPLVQVALLLDTSNSMDGLINQAKTQLWKVVNELLAAKREGQRPEIQVALYEYGKSSLPASEGYIRQVVGLTSDLDKVSEELFALTTNGGDEYCGQVIQRSAKELEWSSSARDLKVIFIAGNEPFTQGPVDFRQAVKTAVERGIIVNTIHCGSEIEGINGRWKDGALAGDGSFMVIDQNRQVAQIAAPQDAEIERLNRELNQTYIPMGSKGAALRERQEALDSRAMSAAPGAAAERTAYKASAGAVASEWDVVDAEAAGKVNVEDLAADVLPDNMKKMSASERRQYVEKQKKRRAEIQSEIRKLSEERKKFLLQKEKEAAEKGAKTLDQAIIESIRQQATRKGFKFE